MLVSINSACPWWDANPSSFSSCLVSAGLLPRPSQYAEGPLTGQQRQLEMIVDSMDNLGRFSGGRCVASGDAIVHMFTMGLSFGEIVAILIGYFLLFLGVTYLVVARSSKKQLKA